MSREQTRPCAQGTGVWQGHAPARAEADVRRAFSMREALCERPALIVFDLDGTIADSRELARESYKRVFRKMGYGEITSEQADAFNGPDADEVCRVMGIGADRRPLYDALIDRTDVELVGTIGKMFPGTGEMLAALADHAVLAILTNGSHAYCDACIDAFGLGPYIALHSGFVSGVTKAERIAMWERELSARRVICVGDRCTDIENARRAGAIAIGVTYGMGTAEELAGADSLCATPQEVERACLRALGGG
ncbi:MAG: HAD hydrolase-like protein [Clostridia bacterium]|nr:HAD hydrolase-like protein [Clostridia bacterium]